MMLARRLLMGGYALTQAGDPYWANVVMLLQPPIGTSDGSTSIVDASSISHAISVVGNTQVDTSTGKPMVLFDGNGDYLSYANNAVFALGASNFTIEAFVVFNGYPVANAGVYAMNIVCKDAPTGRSFALQVNGTVSSITSVTFMLFSSVTTYSAVNTNFTFTLGTIYHIAATRSGSDLKLFVDGVLVGTNTTSLTMHTNTTPVKVGSNGYDSIYWYYLNGAATVRITSGVARYTGNFTAPAFPFPTE